MTSGLIKETILKALKAHKHPDKAFYTTYELSKALGISKSQISLMVKAGTLHPFRLTGKENEPFRFHIDDILKHCIEMNEK